MPLVAEHHDGVPLAAQRFELGMHLWSLLSPLLQESVRADPVGASADARGGALAMDRPEVRRRFDLESYGR